ncbi:MAG: phage minor capsid protein [Oscillospiraceae bacterium]|nr:phage minor capsid protein [Oscillospiraceae bacterium]
MISPAKLDKLPAEVVNLVQELQEEIISDICRRISKANFLTPTAEWELYKANQLNLSYKEVNRRIARRLKVREQTIREIYTDSVRQALKEDADIYRIAAAMGRLPDDTGAKIDRYFRSASFSQLLSKGLKSSKGQLRNLCNSMAAEANRQLSDAMDLAHLKVISGAFSYNAAVYAAVKSLADKGITRVEYPSGRRDNADVCVRRAVLSSVNKSCCDIQLDLAKEVGSNYVEVTAHIGARPSHAEWQGQIYSLVRGDPKYPYFYDATGYGTGEGLGGWNCRHNFFPYFEGIDTPYHTPDFTKTENNEYYALTQKQRAYERAVRDSKRQLAALDGARQSAEDPQLRARLDSDFARRSVTLKNREARLDAFIRDNDLQRDNARVRVVGFGKSVSQKAVHSGNSSYLKYMKQLGIENPPKTIALFNQMMYNNTPEYQMLNAYMTSVKSGMLSPLAGFDKYNEYYNRVQNEIIGIKTATGVEIKSQSKHFLERVFGTPNDPTHENRSRSGVKLEDIIDALKNGKPKQNPKDNTSVSFVTDKCSVAVNIKTGKLIQVNPK